MSHHPIYDKLPAGAHINFPYSAECLTWGELRELLALATHYPDSAEVEWNWYSYHTSSGHIKEPDGIILRTPSETSDE